MEAELGEAMPTKWKPGHEGVPEHWKGLGAGGNAMVWFDGTHAIKRLRPNAGAEPVARFEREAALMAEIAGDKALAVVQTESIRRREGELEIVMERYEGNLDAIIEEFAGKPEKTASALLPIVETLATLAGRENSVHHRDIKPGNLLYRRTGEEIGLALGDFGCAYLAEDDRLTPANRAIGAWAYRPPEYSIGRVERVTEKGDVFGLGKVLWAMLNGERGVVFPGPVWFTDEFDLAKRYPNEPKINRAMIVIAQSCDIREERRPTLAQLAVSLRSLAKSGEDGKQMRQEEAYAAMLRAEAAREIEYQQRRAYSTQFVRSANADFVRALLTLHARYPDSALIAAWRAEYERVGQREGALVDQVAEHESDAPLVNVFYRKTIFNSRFHPMDVGGPIRLTISLTDQTGKVPESVITFSGDAEGLKVSHRIAGGEQREEPYDDTSLLGFLEASALSLAGGRERGT